MSSTDKPEDNPDIEDGEITDDDEEPTPTEPTPESEPNPATAGAQPTIPIIPKSLCNNSDSDSYGAPCKDAGEPNVSDKERSDDKDGSKKDRWRNKAGRKGRDKGNNRDDKTHRHMTEAERSILHLRKKEKIMREREKWDKHHRKDAEPGDDDFAKHIEKTLATILNKKEKEVAALSAGEEVKEEEKRGKKRKKEDRDRNKAKNKQKRMMESPRSEFDENEMLNIRSGSPGAEMRLLAPPYGPPIDHRRSKSPSRSEDSYNSEFSSDEKEERSRRRSTKNMKNRKKENRRQRRAERDQRRANRDEQFKGPLQDSQGVCVFYMQGKCQKNDCPYSHEVSPPMKLELCKFYLMDCCAKGDNCSYMHSEFPCKFYHTGIQCEAGTDCKFAHGRPLSEGLKQILFKHIETAPRDILQGFPRLSRDEALNLINQTQKKLTDQHNNGASTTADQNTTPSTTSATTHNNNSPTTPQHQSFGGPPQQQNYGGGQPQLSGAGLGMYRDRDEYGIQQDARDSNERGDKDGAKGGIPSLFDITVPVPRELAKGLDFEPKMNKNDRHRNNKNSRWKQDQETNMSGGYPMKGFSYGTDQDMRINSNGDIDMRTLPALPSAATDFDVDPYQMDSQQVDVDNRIFTQDIDIRQTPFSRNIPPPAMDVDIRQTPFDGSGNKSPREDKKDPKAAVPDFELPAATRDLLARITANQKDNTIGVASTIDSQQYPTQSENYDEQNINWYSDDDDDDENRLMIKVEDEDTHKRERADSTGSTSEQHEDQASESVRSSSFLSPPQFGAKTSDIVGKLGDLSKIDISAEVTKLLSSMSQSKSLPVPVPEPSADGSGSFNSNTSPKPEGSLSPKGVGTPTDPRMTKQARPDPRQDAKQQDIRQDPRLSDPRHRGRQSSTESKEKEKKSNAKLSIYEQGGIDMKKAALEIDSEDFKSLRPDIDLRNMSLPFKGMQNYTPATEIDASVNSHPPMGWRVVIVEIPRPDYTGLKLSINDAEKTGDPRLRKIFRLSIDEKDSPASPKASPKQSAGGGVRVDPRLRKLEEKIQEPKDSAQTPQMSYNQQLSMLQSSQFYQSLTSNQKLMLNQELTRCDQSGGSGLNDPVLNTVLSSLNLLPQIPTSLPQMGPNSHTGAAVSILANITKMNSLMSNQPLMGQQGLLGVAPGIPNMPPNMPQGMPPDFPMNFDPRGGGPGLLGNGPSGGPGFGQFGGMDQQPPFGGGYNDEYYGGYDDQGNMEAQGINMGPPVGNMGPQGGNMGPRGGHFRQGRGYNNNNKDGRRRGNRDGGFRGGRGNNRGFNKRGGGRDKGDRNDRDKNREGGRGNRGHHSPS